MDTLIAYHNDPALKAAFIDEITKHEVADMVLKGTYNNGGTACAFKGCAIGCSLHSLNKIQGRADVESDTGIHERYPSELGLPLWLAYLEDNIFERLPDDLSKTWPRRFAEAIPAGAVVDDLVLAKILRWTLAADTFGVRYAVTDPKVVAIVDRMAALFDRQIAGDSPSEEEWNNAARAAWDAWDARAAWAARAAWDAWDARAAWAAWDAWAARAARDAWAAWDARAAWAARDAWDARAAWDAWDGFYPALSEYVLSLLCALPVEAK